MEQQQALRKGSFSISIKKEGSARLALVGTTNSGKSTLLNQLTGAKAETAPYPFTTKMPEVGVMDYHGVKIQIIEIPGVVPRFSQTKMGPTFLSLIKTADLIVLLFNTPEEKTLLDKELDDIGVEWIIYTHQEHFQDILWRRLGLLRVYTKQPGKKQEDRPMALRKGSLVKDLAVTVHKDFLKRFRFARVYGPSAKFDGQTVGLDHPLQDTDVVEIHLG